jgi:hypothetical protein
MEAINKPVQNTFDSISKQVSDINLPQINTQQIGENIGNTVNNIAETFDSAKASVANSLNDFSSQNLVNASQDFLNSNSIIAKFVFLILVVIVFLLLLNLGIKLIQYILKPSKNVYLINGLVPGSSSVTVPQNPKSADSVIVHRSNNQSKGIEATWSVWLYVDNISQKTNTSGETFSHIFNKGNAAFDKKGIANVNNAPGLYISDTTNKLRVYMDTVTDNNNFLEITNIPLKKWFHVAIRIQNNILDVYINGTISARKNLTDVPKQNYDDVHICKNGGFQGQLSNLYYADYAMSVVAINNFILKGPNLKQSSMVKTNIGYYSYLSNLWYSSKL